MIKKLALILTLTFLFAGMTQAWQITKELQKELADKRAAVAKAPKDANARFDLAITYAYTNLIQEGWDELKKVNDLDPNFKNTAYKTFEKKVIANPADWRLRFRLAFAYYFTGKKAEAIRELKNVLILDPNNVFAYGYISLIYGEMNETDKAIEYAKAGLKKDELVAALHLLLSSGYYRKGDNWNGFWEGSTAVRLKLQGY
jgi:tetratricopeptide (TPR) repeat protein